MTTFLLALWIVGFFPSIEANQNRFRKEHKLPQLPQTLEEAGFYQDFYGDWQVKSKGGK